MYLLNSNRLATLIFSIFLFCSLQMSGQMLDKLNPFKKSEPKADESLSISPEESKTIINDIIQLEGSNMRGRIQGTTGEQVAITYLAKRFRDLGLVEVDKNFQRKYSYATNEVLSEESYINLDNKMIKVPSESFPLSFTDTQLINTYILANNNESHSVWVLPAFKTADEAKKSKEDKEKLLYQKALNAKERGAIGVIFYNNFGNDFILSFRHATTMDRIGIPVYEISRAVYDEKFSKARKLTSLNMKPVISRHLKQGINLYGIINNGAEKTVVLSANYDGYLPPNVDPKTVKNLPGANANASGVATLLALAQKLTKVKTNFNYIVILYSGTYLDQVGSERMFDDKNFFKDKLAFAMHFDQVGRMNPATKDIFVSGVGTFTGWRNFFNKKAPGSYDYVLESKGKTLSDANTYYDHKLPFLRFSTGPTEGIGTERDNHKLINMQGIGEIINKSFSIITQLSAQKPNMDFIAATDEVPIVIEKPIEQTTGGQPKVANQNNQTKTNLSSDNKPKTNVNQNNQPKTQVNSNKTNPPKQAPKSNKKNEKPPVSSNPRRSSTQTVSLGVEPDLSFNEGGLKISKVNKGQDASNAGVIEGDIIIQIKNFPIQSYDDYINALSNFKKGEKTSVKLKRKGSVINKLITFS